VRDLADGVSRLSRVNAIYTGKQSTQTHIATRICYSEIIELLTATFCQKHIFLLVKIIMKMKMLNLKWIKPTIELKLRWKYTRFK
jgi:hypothetical protein